MSKQYCNQIALDVKIVFAFKAYELSFSKALCVFEFVNKGFCHQVMGSFPQNSNGKHPLRQ